MGTKKDDIKEKKTNALDAKFVKKKENETKIKPISFFGMFKYASKGDKLLMFIGTLSAVITGCLPPINTILFGELAGNAVQYAETLYNATLSQNEQAEAQEKFFDGIKFFALANSMVGVAMLCFSYLSTITFNYSSTKQIFQIRSDYLKSILNQDISWYDQNQTGDFASRMSDDLSKFEDGIGEKVPMFIHFQVLFVAAVGTALAKGWELALISLVAIPASLVSFGVINLLTTKLAKNEMEAYAASGSIAEEVFSLIRTVTAFGGQQKEIDRYKEHLVSARKNNIKRTMIVGIGFGLVYLLLYSSYALSLWYGVKLVLKDRFNPNASYTPANMVTIFFAVLSASLNFGAASTYLEMFAISKAAAAKIFNVIESKPDINLSKSNGAKLDHLKGNIQFKNVKFHYPSRPDIPVLQGLDIEINPGETVALVGSSGCGKSTVVQLIQRFYNAVSGEILVDGTNIQNLDLTWYRNNIGVVGQEPVLFGTTILENIRYGKEEATEEEIIEAAKKANAHAFIKLLPKGYNTLVGERGTQLSGGQKQRIAIARALVRKPTLLLLDEATSALDNASEAKVQEALDLASAECTTIIVAHRLSTIRGANKIIVLLEGTVVEQGTHDELISLTGEYFKLVTAQVASSNQIELSNDETETKGNNEAYEEYNDDDDDISDDEKNEIDDFKNGKKITLFSIMKLNAPEWPYILIAGVGSIVVGWGWPIFAVFFGSVLGTLAKYDTEYIETETTRYCIFFVIAGVICMISVFLQNYLLGIAGEKMTERIRTQMFTAIISQEMGFFDKKSNGVGALCAKLAGDSSSIQGATGQRVGAILQSLSTFGIAIALSMYYQWKLGLLMASFTPLMLVAIFIEKRNTTGLSEAREKSLQKSTKIAVEAVGNIRTVAGLVAEDKFQKSYITELKPHYKAALAAVHWRGLVFGLSRSLGYFAYAAAMYYGGFLIRDGLYYDKVFKVAQAQLMGTISIANSLAFTPNLNRGISAAKRIKSFLSRIPLIRDGPSSKPMNQVDGNIGYSNVEFFYPTRKNIQVLRGLTINIPKGSTVALVGESGCGKSTIIQLIERFYDPSSGDINLDEQNIKHITLSSLRSHLGIVPQEPNLFNKSIAENIAYGDNSRNVPIDEIIQAAKNANIHNFIVGLPNGYDTELGEKATQLSGGQKQRIAIARALVQNPKILLLDEATSALDTESEKVVQAALDEAKKGRTCITIAHRLTTIQDADIIYVIDKGIVVESGTHRELLNKNGFYYKLYTQKH
uniref:ABC-type xenobiotic transporter n=1 Tax=Diabrotica virgifera TaxID=50389 RepID=A0A866WKL0_DIAVI|nr:ATP binding cassette transporter subtype B2 [Diabrotica virgifera]